MTVSAAKQYAESSLRRCPARSRSLQTEISLLQGAGRVENLLGKSISHRWKKAEWQGSCFCSKRIQNFVEIANEPLPIFGYACPPWSRRRGCDRCCHSCHKQWEGKLGEVEKSSYCRRRFSGQDRWSSRGGWNEKSRWHEILYQLTGSYLIRYQINDFCGKTRPARWRFAGWYHVCKLDTMWMIRDIWMDAILQQHNSENFWRWAWWYFTTWACKWKCIKKKKYLTSYMKWAGAVEEKVFPVESVK